MMLDLKNKTFAEINFLFTLTAIVGDVLTSYYK